MSTARLVSLVVFCLAFGLGFVSPSLATPVNVNYSTTANGFIFVDADLLTWSGQSSPPPLTLDTTIPTTNGINYATYTAFGFFGSENFTVSYDLTLDGVTHTMSQSGLWQGNITADPIQTYLSAPVLFITSAGNWDVSLNPFSFNGFDYQTESQILTATFTPVPMSPTPEPVSFVLFGSGLTGIVLLLRKGLLA